MNADNTQPTYRRQRFLLAFIRQINSSVSSTDLQKLVFMHTMKTDADFYEFLPYKYGAYSFQLAEDVDILCRDGHLTAEGTGIKAAGEYQLCDLFDIAVERGNQLIRKTYCEYPYYTINSEMIDSLFYGKEAEQFNSEKQKYVNHCQVLFTIGYEGRSIESFANVLIKNGINLLCDVRKNSLSRKFGFSKSKLEHIMQTVGIKYIHMPDLGIESDKRSSLETAEDYEKLFAKYAENIQLLNPCLESVFSLLCSYKRIALMCYEKDATMCHRHVIRDCIVNGHDVSYEDL
ncbi:MAG: DUF488 domain-containing protein [Clostridiales bacterium]|nr:DUF488 domain-containing protein [Clostridiales bacterium]